jgi:tetratricopeptide (TPR) repeat protein
MYAEAESLEREGWKMEEPQPAALARMLAERGRKIDEAVTLAEQAARLRHDIFTMDALAWAYFQAGRIPDARAASLEALRTGSMDRRIRCHAKAIEDAANFNMQGALTHCGFETWITDANARS